MKEKIEEQNNKWLSVSLGDIASSVKGKKPKKLFKKHQKGLLPYINIKAFEKGIFDQYTNGEKCTFCKEGDLLIVWDGSRSGLVGQAYDGVVGSTLSKISIPLIKRDFLFYFLKSKYLQLNTRTRGSGTPHVDPDLLWNYAFPVVSKNDQHRIVSKIEELFSDLDSGIENLKKAQAQLKTYRQAVLKYAFEGKLTEEWRKQNKPEPAEKLLERIKQEREKQFQKQLDDRESAVKKWEKEEKSGKKPAKLRGLKKLSPLTEKELKELSDLPEGWEWVRLGNLSMGVEYGSSQKSLKKGNVPVLRMGNIQNGYFEWGDLVYTNDTEEIDKYLLKTNDVLFNRTNSPELVGKTAIYLREQPAIFAGYLIRINQINEINPKYLNFFLNCHIAKKLGNRVKTDGVNQSNINGEKLSNYPFPLTSSKEQHQIVQEIESRLSVCDKLEQSIEESLKKSEALRQSILKKAFEGKLVPQDPNDEPAEKLLERIKVEKEKLEAENKSKRRKKK